MSGDSPPALDPSQRVVAELPAEARALVIAGAGQGKTEVVAARLEHLVHESGLEPADEIVVLSFSRAAVAAARRRTKGRGAVARVAVRTFDSLASRLLAESGNEEPGHTFDGRIRQATRLLESGDPEIPTVDMLRHVIIDEVQDLVGDRASFVFQLLKRLDDDAGFTALGDPLQSIYDFQLERSKRKAENQELLDALTGQLGATEMALERYYRARSEDAEAVVTLAETLRREHAGERRLSLTEAFLQDLVTATYPDELSRVVPRWQGSTAILSRTNGQGMCISEELARAGLAHRLRRPAEELAVPAWVAVALAQSPSRRIDRATTAELIAATPGAPPPDLAWPLLKATERRRNVPDLDLVELAARISTGDVPVELADDGTGELIVSTVHRAKGLEFDNVLVAETDENPNVEVDPDERAREIFVAISRARNRLVSFALPRQHFVFKETRPPFRWIRTGRRGAWVTSGFEFQPSDIRTRRPAEEPDRTAAEIQDALARGIPAGTLADGVLDPRTAATDTPRYRLSVNQTTIGYTTHEFGRALATRLDRAWPKHPGWPVGLTGIVVDSVVTVAGPPVMGRQAGIGRWGLWLAPRAGGLAGLVYAKSEGSNP